MKTSNPETSKSPAQNSPVAVPGASPGAPKERLASQLVSFGDKITYVFALGKEIGSIHFDRARREIFFKGHNIRNMEIEEWQEQALEAFRKVLATSEKGRPFADLYGRTLDKVILEKERERQLSHPAV